MTNFHKTIKKVSEDIESMKFNTAIACLMTLLNDIYSAGSITKGELLAFCTLLYPFAPHISEEIYFNNSGKVLSEQSWISYDEKLCQDETVEIVAQVNGKVRTKLNIAVDSDRESVIEMAMADEKVRSAVAGKSVVKQIYVPNKLVNIVVK